MKRGTLLAVLIAALPLAQAAAQGGAISTAAPPLDRFTAQYGFQTFPPDPAYPPDPIFPYQVPYIWNGPDYDALRIGDLTKVPIFNQAAASPSAPSGSVLRPGFKP